MFIHVQGIFEAAEQLLDDFTDLVQAQGSGA
jgi:hypothetical protein